MIGISKKALKNLKIIIIIINQEHLIERSLFSRTNCDSKKNVEKIMPFNEWWSWFWENDKTLLITIPEHSKKSYDINNDIFKIDMEIGLFQIKYKWVFLYKKMTGKFLKDLAILNLILNEKTFRSTRDRSSNKFIFDGNVYSKEIKDRK